jgi:hypothetical protein
MRGGIFGFDGIADPAQEIIRQRDIAVTRERDKTVGEIGVACAKRCLDVVLNQAIIVRESRIELELGQGRGIVLGGENRAGLPGMRRYLREHKAACSNPGQR